MAYSNGYSPCLIPNILLATTTSGVLRAIDIGAASADHGELLCVRSCSLQRVQFTLTEEAASGTSTAPTVIIKKRPTPLSATGESTLATITVPSGGAIGATYFVDLEADLAVGDSIEISHTVGVGTPTGIGVASLLYNEDPEVPANNTELIESA